EKYAGLKDSGTSVDDYISQGNLFGAETTPFQTRVMQVFDQHRRSPKAIRSIVGNFLDLAEEAGDPNQRNFFGEKDAIDIKSAFEAAVKKYEDTTRSNEPAQDRLFGADSNQGLRLQPEADGDVSQGARQKAAETEESRQDWIEDAPLYIKPGISASKPDEKQAESLARDLSKNAEAYRELKYGDEKTAFNKERINNAEIKSFENVLYANADAMELLRQAHGQAFQLGNTDTFFGAYQNPRHTRAVREALEYGVLGGQYGYATKRAAQELLKTYDKAVESSGYGDSRIIATNADAPRGLRIAKQEESAHQADYRIGLEHSVGKEVVRSSMVGRKAMRNLQRGAYEGASNSQAAMETTAKLFVDDNQELGLTKQQNDELADVYLVKLLSNGANAAQIEKHYGNISKKGKRYAERAKQLEFQRSPGSDESVESNRATPFYNVGESGSEARQRRGSQSDEDFAPRPGPIGTGFLDAVGSGNQSLTKASPKDLRRAAEFFEAVDLAPLYSKASPSQKNSIATMLAPIWKGRTEESTPVKEVITNFRRAGLLTAPKTHLKNMASNTLMQASEEASRPIAILADITASAVTGQRTVQTISLPGLMKSFGALVHQDATLKSLDKESGVARAWNILKNGDISELDKNQLKEMQSGSPILDAMVNYTFRLLGAEDALFKTYAMRRSLEESAKTLAISERRTDKSITVSKRRAELLKNPTNEMLLEAELNADFSTFTNNNPVSETLTKIKDTNSYAKFAIETIVPYDKTPTNIIARTLEYTPLGLGWAGKHLYDLKRGESYTFRKMREARDREQKEIAAQEKEVRESVNQKFAENMEALDGLIRNAKTQTERDNLTAEKERHRKNFQILKGKRKLEDGFREIDRQEIQDAMDKVFPRIAQQQFARSVGRSGLGTAALGLGIYLAMEGLLSGVWDAGERDEMTEFYDRKDLGILNASLQIGNRRYGIGDTPLGKVMALGASIYERSQKPLKKGETENTKPFNDLSDVAKITVMEQPLLNSLDDYFGKGKTVEQRIGGLLGSFVPSILANVADVRDDAARDNKSWYSGINRIPGARNYNTEAKHPREPYLRDETNRLIDKFDPFNSRPVTAKIPGGKVELLPEQKQKRLETLRRTLSVTQNAKLKESYEKQIKELEERK
ncbi:MAG: hypothetical protein M3388_08320, partial [Acidobacteriota bacterium]|nr:hypothetical protein [Acidobacteriota bacterium]